MEMLSRITHRSMAHHEDIDRADEDAQALFDENRPRQREQRGAPRRIRRRSARAGLNG